VAHSFHHTFLWATNEILDYINTAKEDIFKANMYLNFKEFIKDSIFSGVFSNCDSNQSNLDVNINLKSEK